LCVQQGVYRSGDIADFIDGFALMLLSLISLARDGNWSASRPVVYGTYLACVAAHGMIATFFGRIMPKIQAVCIVFNVGLVLATVIALPIGNKVHHVPINSGSYVFGTTENLTTWPTGWAFMIAWLSPIWTIGAFDSCVHMSEEATHASRSVPLGIIWSCGMCGVLGFLSLVIIAAVMDTNVDNILNTPFGQPMAQVCIKPSHVVVSV
jgi:amino acid transporter